MKLYLKKLLFWAVAFLIGMNLLGAVKLNILAKEPDPLPCTRYYKSVLFPKETACGRLPASIVQTV